MKWWLTLTLGGILLLFLAACGAKQAPPTAPPLAAPEAPAAEPADVSGEEAIEAPPPTPPGGPEPEQVLTGSVIAGSSSTCSDSDGGLEYRYKGMVSGTESGQSYELKDVCIGPFLVEWYCDGNDAVSRNIRCEDEDNRRCVDGMCV